MQHNPNDSHRNSLSFLERLAAFITRKVGTMLCAIFFAALAFVSLPAVLASHSTMLLIAWITQSFLQLVLLPIIMVGQNLQSRHSTIVADHTYRASLMSEHQNEVIISNLKLLLETYATDRETLLSNAHFVHIANATTDESLQKVALAAALIARDGGPREEVILNITHEPIRRAGATRRRIKRGR